MYTPTRYIAADSALDVQGKIFSMFTRRLRNALMSVLQVVLSWSRYLSTNSKTAIENDVHYLLEGVLNGNRAQLAKAITLGNTTRVT